MKKNAQYTKTKEFLSTYLDEQLELQNGDGIIIISFPESNIGSVGGSLAYHEFLKMLEKNYSIKKEYRDYSYTGFGVLVFRPIIMLHLTLLKKE